MNVQLNTTTPNTNFKAHLTKNAQTFVNRGINRLCLLPEYRDYERAKQLAEGIVDYMKNIQPVGGHAVIDMSESGDSLVCKIYSQKQDICELKECISSINIHEHPFLDALLDFRYKLIPIKEDPCIRPNSDFIDEDGYDVRKTYRAATNYKPMEWSMVSGTDKSGRYWSVGTIGRY